MPRTDALYSTPLTLLTDLYQLTMAYGYFKCGLAERESVFHLFYRTNPFDGGYALACGLEQAADLLERFRFHDADVDYLRQLTGNDGEPLFDADFLDYLRSLEPRFDVDVVPEGTVVFPHEPLVRMRGPLLQCQILETPLLNTVNFQTLIATKASRICHAARGEPVMDFGLRRAQGFDGALSAARAAYVGGCVATSNVLAGRLYGIPVKGTHAHSWVMCFDGDREAFEAYADAMPNNCVFLVDTYDTLEGIEHAIAVGKRLRHRGHELVGVRLDSGDLAHLSLEARQRLDAAGFPDAVVIASNDLDEHIIASLKEQGAQIAVWGVGTKLATAFDQPALGGVYKLAALRDEQGGWRHAIKLSEQPIKVSNPGVQQIRRWFDGDTMVADTIYDEETGIDGSEHYPLDQLSVPTSVPAATRHEDLLVPMFRSGRRSLEPVLLDDVRLRAAEQLQRLDKRTRRLLNPQRYPVGLEPRLRDLKVQLMRARKGTV